MKKSKKILALIFAVTMLFGINTSYVKAEDEGAAEILNCSYGIPHPCYVMGQPASCQTHYYTIRTPYYCKECDAFLYYKYTYSELQHQYKHSN